MYKPLPEIKISEAEFSLWNARVRRELEHLGEGFYASVYAYKTGRVLKVTAMYDRGYNAFLRMAVANQNNPCFPRIYRAVMLTVHNDARREPGRVIVVEMERLSPWNHDKPFPMFEGWVTGNGYYSRGEVEVKVTNSAMMQARALLNRARDEAWERDEPVTFDIHSANVMMRGRQVVFTDPMA